MSLCKVVTISGELLIPEGELAPGEQPITPFMEMFQQLNLLFQQQLPLNEIENSINQQFKIEKLCIPTEKEV